MEPGSHRDRPSRSGESGVVELHASTGAAVSVRDESPKIMCVGYGKGLLDYSRTALYGH
jgi:hypothetical protein